MLRNCFDVRQMSWTAPPALLVPTEAMSKLCFTTLYNHLRQTGAKVRGDERARVKIANVPTNASPQHRTNS